MKNSSFQCLRSINNQLHNKIIQENEYESYLKRIENIVDRKPFRDTSPEFYMNFLQTCKDKSKMHKNNEENTKIVYENKHLLNKIMQSRLRKADQPSQSYHLHMYEKRNRQIERINDQNLRMAKRLTDQYSTLRKSLITKDLSKTYKDRSTQKKTNYSTWNYSPIKQRKLPKLVGSPRKKQILNESFVQPNINKME